MKVPLGQIFILPKGSAVVNQTRYVPIESSARNEESNANVLRFEFSVCHPPTKLLYLEKQATIEPPQ